MRLACSRFLIALCLLNSAGKLAAAETVQQVEAPVSGAPVSGAPATVEGALLVARVQEDLRAANDARSRHGAEIQAWHLEQERLATALNALQAEVARGEQALAAAAAERANVRAELAQRGSGTIPLAQHLLAEAARTTHAHLVHVASGAPSGLVQLPSDDSFDAVLLALEATEKSIGQVAVEISAGHLEGTPAEARTAVRLLRVGALAWWTSLDGAQGGTVGFVGGRMEFQIESAIAHQVAIRQAIAMAEGRMPAEPVALPVRATSRAGDSVVVPAGTGATGGAAP